MRYSQPFGTPAPPEGQYPRYINGDPVTGTEGSIPPATAFDECQIEILSVIEGVRNLGLIGAPGAPSHADLTQLWQAINAFFNKQYITTAITKTVHGAGADFPDLIAAFKWLANYIITPTGFVTFLVSPGKWTYTQSVELNHANIARVAVQGAAMNAMPTGNQFSVTGYHNATDGINQAIYLRACFQTELAFQNGVSGFVVLRGGCTLRYLLITGDLTVASGPPNMWGDYGIGSGLELYDRVQIAGVFCWGFGKSGWYVFGPGGVYTSANLTNGVCYCRVGVSGYNGYMNLDLGAGTIMTSNQVCGFFCYGGMYFFGHNSHVRGNDGGGGLGGITLEAGAQVQIQGNISQNNGSGVYLAGACTFVGEQTTYAYNTYGAATVYGTCTAWMVDSSMYSNGQSWCVAASGCSYAEILRNYVDVPPTSGYGAFVAGP